MNGIKLKKKKSISSTLIRYVFGVFFLFSSAVSFSSSFIAGLLFLLATLIAIPPTAAQLERKFNISMSGNLRFFVVLILVILASFSMPHVDSTTALNNSTEVIASPLTSANGGSTIAVPASTETSELTTTPEAVTTPDNKGTLDIITNPTGAIVTVDGVSQGLSPVNDLSVDEGNHVIDLYLSGYNPKTLTVYVTNSDTKTIDWTFTPYVDSSSTETKTSEVTPTETPEVTPTETPTSEPAETQVTTSDSEPTTTSNTIDTNSGLLYASSESDVYHASWCSYVERIKPENLITFDSVQEAEAAGYRACKKCGG